MIYLKGIASDDSTMLAKRSGLRSFVTVLILMSVMTLVLPQVLSSSQVSLAPQLGSASDWSSWASTAWSYYAPGVGVNSATGLHRATLSWTCFTNWDLGSYIYAIIFARKLNLITDSGVWQFQDRVNRVLAFLQTRPLRSNPPNSPYLAYSWTGTVCSDTGNQPTDPADAGRLLSALNALKVFSPPYSSQVNSIFAKSKATYDIFASSIGYDYYGYLAAEGYSAFGYDESAVFNSIDNYSGSYVTVFGQSLPAVTTLAEPLNHLILETTPSSKLSDFATRVYLAQRGRWNNGAGPLTAWSEGGYSPNPVYIYECIIDASGGNIRTWVLKLGSTTYNVAPLAYTKVAFAYLAIYGVNSYTSALVNAVKGLASSQGFGEGAFENGSSAISAWGSNSNGFYSDKTNEFILAAAYHVLSGTTTTQTTTSTGSNVVSSIGSAVMTAGAGTVTFVLPDYVGPYHSSATKCGGVNAAQLSDYSAGGYMLGLLSNPQNQLLDSNSGISKSDCGNPVGIVGTIVTLAGPGVNEVVHYYEQVAQITPVFFMYNGVNNFVVRATGQRYAFNTAPGADYFLVEAFTDSSGRRVFTLYGFSWQGTLAAGVFFATYVYPQLAQFTGSWYIYQWKDAANGSSANNFPDPGDGYTMIASSGSAPSLTPRSNSGTIGPAYSGFAGINNDVFGAAQGAVYFVMPDYSGAYHTSAFKCGGVSAATLSDYSAGGYMLSVLSSDQNEVLDTSGLVSSSSCGQFVGTTSVLVTLAGPGVNTAVHYYEQVAANSPVYFLWDGSRNNFVVRATGQKYTVPPNGAGNTAPGHDLFLLDSFVDAQGRHVYVVYGFSWQGTLAAATFLNTYVRQHLSQFTSSWYIYEWKDAVSGSSANSFPDARDQYSLIATG